MLDGGNREPDDADAEWRRLVDATWSTPSDRAEIDRLLETAGRPQPGSRGRRPGSIRTLLIVLVVLPLLVGLKVVAPDIPGWWDYLVHCDPTFRVGAGAPVVAPPKDGRVRAAVPVPDVPSSTEYSFLQLEPDGSPVMFNPCRTIHYVIHDPVGLGDAGRDAVTRAATEMSMVTGLAFVFDGYTDEAPSTDRALTVPHYSSRWAPVLIAWSDPEETPRLAGRVVGLGIGRSARGADGQYTYVSGHVWLDTPSLAPRLGSRSGFEAAQSVVMHELGHVVGAGHAQDSGQLMSAAGGLDTSFGDGDRYVFAKLGRGSCASGL